MWLFVAFPGVFLISNDLKDVKYFLFGDEKPDIERSVKRLLAYENLEIFPELESAVEEIKKGEDEVLVDDELSYRLLSDNFPDLKIKLVSFGNELIEAKTKLGEIIRDILGGDEYYAEFVSKVGIELTRSRIMEEGEKRDQMIIKAVTIQEDLTKMFNILASHVREWYGFYFHELGKVVEDHELYLKLILELGRIENFTKENLENLIHDKKLIKDILKATEEAVPIKLTERDLERIKAICRLALEIQDERQRIMEYLDDLMKEAAPNIRSLIGPVIGAKLIRRAGGLEQLAKMPASTIQILGAEKALFRALHGRGTPPKHGIIFQDPRVFKSPRWQRGKIARALAGKLAIAARVDYFSGEYIGDELASELEKRIEEIKIKYPKPPLKKEKKKVKTGKPKPKGKKFKGKKKR